MLRQPPFTNAHTGISLYDAGAGRYLYNYQGDKYFVPASNTKLFSLYAGLASMRVGREDMLSLGDTVGLASEKLYFEIRVENRPEDPQSWLR